MQDAQGDGWVGGVNGYYNVWQLYDATTGDLKNRGTLAENHDSGETKLCLEDGSYVFNTTASAAFAEDIQWGVCDAYGLAGACVGFVGRLFCVMQRSHLSADGECKKCYLKAAKVDS